MKRFLIYTKLRLKAVMKIFPSMCIMTLLLCLSLGGMLYMQSATSLTFSEGDEDARVSIGIAGVDDSGAFGAAFPVLLKMDPSKSEVNFILYDTKKEAVDAIRKHEILSAIVIPDGVVSTLLAGGLDRMTLIVPASSAGLEALIMRELSKSVSTILGAMNSASNVLSDYYVASGTTDPEIISNAQTDLLLTSMQDMIHRNHMFKIRYVRSEQQLSIESFYLVSMVLLLFLLTGVMCAGSFIRSDYALPKLLNLRRLGSSRQVLAEYIKGVRLVNPFGYPVRIVPVWEAEQHPVAVFLQFPCLEVAGGGDQPPVIVICKVTQCIILCINLFAGFKQLHLIVIAAFGKQLHHIFCRGVIPVELGVFFHNLKHPGADP